MMQFDFGQNWKRFVNKALTNEKIEQSRKDFIELFRGIELRDRTFLDIGFGQGLTLCFAKQTGAKVKGLDINTKCHEALSMTASMLGIKICSSKDIVIGSILDTAILGELRNGGNEHGCYDIVHSWGVLHHTGDMNRAIDIASSFVAENGHFVIAIYNKHFTSRLWLLIKWTYVHVPALFQKALIALLYPMIWVAKFAVTGVSPVRQSRGMDFFYNVIDWVGGYPYEYASKQSVVEMMKKKGFFLQHFIPATVPTGCNEYVFTRSLPDKGEEDGNR